jgi:hypothetical protein
MRVVADHGDARSFGGLEAAAPRVARSDQPAMITAMLGVCDPGLAADRGPPGRTAPRFHADVAVHENDRLGLERLRRYGLRPPLSLARLSRPGIGGHSQASRSSSRCAISTPRCA